MPVRWLPPAEYFSRPGKVPKSGLRASPRDPSGARTPCGGSALRLWTMDVTKAGQGQEKPASLFPPTGVSVLLYDKDAPTVARRCLPILKTGTKADGLVIPLRRSACLTEPNARLPHGSSPFLWQRLGMAESGGFPRASAGHRFRHLPEGSRGEPLVSFPPAFRNRKAGPPEAGHRSRNKQNRPATNHQ